MPGFGAKAIPAEYGMMIHLTKPDILETATADDLKRKGVRFVAICVDQRRDESDCLVFGVTRNGVKDTAGLMCRALGEAKMGEDPSETLAMALSGEETLIQMKATASDLLQPYVRALKESSGNCRLRTFSGEGREAGQIPEEMVTPCKCEKCAGARGGW